MAVRGPLMRITVLTCTVASLLAASAPTVEAAPPPPQTPKWAMYEVELEGTQSPSNPFTDATLTATVRDPEGASFIIDGFYDGDGQGGQSGNVWKIRFSPGHLGVWHWTITSNDPGLDKWSGEFECVASGEAGPVIAKGRHFYWADGGPVYLVGNFLDSGFSHRERFSHTLLSEEIDEQNRQNMIARHRDFHRANKMNIYLANKGDYTDISTTPWGGNDVANDKSRFDLTRWRMYDRIISQVGKEGMIAELWFFADDSGFGDLPDEDRKHLIKYAMARLSGYPHTMFVLCLEWQEQWTKQEVLTYLAYGQDHNPWRRLWSVHGVDGDFAFPDVPSVDFMATQPGNAVHPAANNDHTVRNRSLADKPLLVEELGSLSGPSDKRLRGNLWAAFCGGAAGSGTGSDLPRLRKFIEDMDVEFWNMSPDNSLASTGFVLASRGNDYVVYTETGTALTVQLVPGTYHAEWFNPRQQDDGADTIPAGTVDGGSQSFSPPNSDDWVLHIKAAVPVTGHG